MTRCFTRNETLSSINEEIASSKCPILSFTSFLAIFEWFFKKLLDSDWPPNILDVSHSTRQCLRISASPDGHVTSHYSGYRYPPLKNYFCGCHRNLGQVFSPFSLLFRAVLMSCMAVKVCTLNRCNV